MSLGRLYIYDSLLGINLVHGRAPLVGRVFKSITIGQWLIRLSVKDVKAICNVRKNRGFYIRCVFGGL